MQEANEEQVLDDGEIDINTVLEVAIVNRCIVEYKEMYGDYTVLLDAGLRTVAWKPPLALLECIATVNVVQTANAHMFMVPPAYLVDEEVTVRVTELLRVEGLSEAQIAFMKDGHATRMAEKVSLCAKRIAHLSPEFASDKAIHAEIERRTVTGCPAVWLKSAGLPDVCCFRHPITGGRYYALGVMLPEDDQVNVLLVSTYIDTCTHFMMREVAKMRRGTDKAKCRVVRFDHLIENLDTSGDTFKTVLYIFIHFAKV